MAKMTEAELADYYNETKDLSEFDEANAVSLTGKRSVTISVRFSDEEIQQLRDRAEQAGARSPRLFVPPLWRQRARWIGRRWASLPAIWSSAPIWSPSWRLGARD